MKGAMITGWVLDIFKIFFYASLVAVLFLIFGISFIDVTNIISNLLSSLWNWFF